ncbi:hypothetical protein AB1Y20_007403 [Prymnesium parvum]|uniref:Uncharacterized protein n=1 Tax=Prymnesium parvum TaxID=97485 RepID=A0AB34IX11_PRYPA
MPRYARERRPVHEAPLAVFMPRLPTEDVIELPFDVSVIRLRTESEETALYRRVHKKALLASAMDELSKPCPRADGYLYGRYARAELTERPSGAIRVATDAGAGAGDVLASEWNIPCSLSPRQPTTLIFHDGAYQYAGPELPMETEILRRTKLTQVEIDEGMGRTVRAWYASLAKQLARSTLSWLPGVSRFVHFFFNHLVCAIAWIAAVRGGTFENSRAVWFQIFVLVALRCVRDHLDLLYETLWPPSANRWLEWLLEHAFFRGVYKAFSVLRSFVGTRGVVSVVLGLGALLNAWVNGDEPGELASSLWSAMEPIVAAMVPEYGLVRIGLSMGRGWYDDQPFGYYHYMALGCAAASLVCSLTDTGGASCRNLTFLPGILETVGRFLVHFQTLRDFGGVLRSPSMHALEKVLEEACSWQWRAYSAQKAGVVLLYDGWHADAFFRELRVLRMLSATLVDELQQLKDKESYTDDEAGRAMTALYTLDLNFPAVFTSLERSGSDEFQKLHTTVAKLMETNRKGFKAWYERLAVEDRGTLNLGSKRAPLDRYLVRLIRKTLFASAPISDDDVAMAADGEKAEAKLFQAVDQYQQLLVDHLRARISALPAMAEGTREEIRALEKLRRRIAKFTHDDKKQAWEGVATEQLEEARRDVFMRTQREKEIDPRVVEEARFSDEQTKLVHEFNAMVRARGAREHFRAIREDMQKLQDASIAEEQLLGTLARLGKSIGIAEYKYDDLLRTHGASWDDTQTPPKSSQSPFDWFSISALFGALVRLVLARIAGTDEGGGHRAEEGATGSATAEETGGAAADAPGQRTGEAEPGVPEEAAPPTPGPESAQHPGAVETRGGRLKIVPAPRQEDRGLDARREQVVRHIEEQKKARRAEQKRVQQRGFLERVVRRAKDVKAKRSEVELRLERQKNAELAREIERLAAEAKRAAGEAEAAKEKLSEQAFDVAMAEEAARSAVRELRVVGDRTARLEGSAATLADQLARAERLSAEEKGGLQSELQAADGALAAYRQRLAELEATIGAERARATRDREHLEEHARELQARLGQADAHASHELASLEAKLGAALEQARAARAREEELSAELAGARAREEALVAEKVKLEKVGAGRRAANLRSAIEAGDVALMKAEVNALRGASDADDPHVAKATRLIAAIESLEAAMQEGWLFSPDTTAIRTTLERHRREGLMSAQVYDRFAQALRSMERHDALEKALSAADVDAVLADGPVDATSVQRAYHRILERERDKQARSEAEVERLRAAQSTAAEEVRALREKLQKGDASEGALQQDLAAKTDALGAMRKRLADLEEERLQHQDAHKRAATGLRRLEHTQEGLEGIIAMQRRNITGLERQLGAMRSDVDARLEAERRHAREADSRAQASDRLVAAREDEKQVLAHRLRHAERRLADADRASKAHEVASTRDREKFVLELQALQELVDEKEALLADGARRLAEAEAIRTTDEGRARTQLAHLRHELQTSRRELSGAYTSALSFANRTSDPGVVAMVGLDTQKVVLPTKVHKPALRMDNRLLNRPKEFLEVLQYLLKEHREKFVKVVNDEEYVIFRGSRWYETDKELKYLGAWGPWAKVWKGSPSTTLARLLRDHGTAKVEDMLERAIAVALCRDQCLVQPEGVH